MDNSEQKELVAAEMADTDPVPPAQHECAERDEASNESTAAELAKLGEDFRRTHENLQQCNVRLEADRKRSTAEAIACGRILIQAKKLAGHGGWMTWLKDHAKISVSTAERYMHLARKSSSVTNLTAKTLTECYTALGLIHPPKTDSKETHPSGNKRSEFVRAKGLSVRLWNLLIGTKDADKMAKEIEGIIAWYQEYLEKKKKEQEGIEREREFEKARAA